MRGLRGRASRWARAHVAPRACRVLGHVMWYYEPEEAPDDLWFGCCRCRAPGLVRDKIEVRPVPGHPEIAAVDRAALLRLRARLDVL